MRDARMSRTVTRLSALGSPCSHVMSLLADQTRLKIVELLLVEEFYVEELNARLRIDPTLLSYHLASLRKGKLIIGTRIGRYIRYAISPAVRSSVQSSVLDFGCCKVSFDVGPRRPAR